MQTIAQHRLIVNPAAAVRFRNRRSEGAFGRLCQKGVAIRASDDDIICRRVDAEKTHFSDLRLIEQKKSFFTRYCNM